MTTERLPRVGVDYYASGEAGEEVLLEVSRAAEDELLIQLSCGAEIRLCRSEAREVEAAINESRRRDWDDH